MTRLRTADDLHGVGVESALPANLPVTVLALWLDLRGDWDRAHRLAQGADDSDGAWVHAYLHRKEGDLNNAAYWYRRAGKPVATESLELEWRQIVTAILDRV